MPNVENKKLDDPSTKLSVTRESFLKYIASNTLVFVKDLDMFSAQIEKLFSKAEEAFKTISEEIKHSKPEELFCDSEIIKRQLLEFKVVELSTQAYLNPVDIIEFNTKPQPTFNKQFDLLIDNLIENTATGYTNYIFCVSDQQAKRFHDIFDDQEREVKYQTVVLSLYQGFIDETSKMVCYTDHQIFERYHKFQLKSGYAKKQAITFKELSNLEVGDYVTHIDHGIGRFGGLQKIDVEGKKQEAIKLVYGERDILYLSIHSLHKISKFNGKDGKPPKIYKLGSNAWKNLKEKTKSRVKHIAYNLIELYAKRRLQKGFAFGPYSYLQHRREASFIY